MGANASTNRKKMPPPRPGNYLYPSDPFGPSPRPVDRDRPSPRPARPGEYQNEIQPTESTINGAVNPWLDTTPIPPQRAAVPSYQPPVDNEPAAGDNAPYVSQEPNQQPPRGEPPPYRPAQQPPPPIYQPVRPRPYLNQSQRYGALSQPPPPPAPPPPPPPPHPPNRYAYPRIPRYNPRPRYIHQPYAVEPLTYRKPHANYEPQYAHAPKAKPYTYQQPVPEAKMAVSDQDQEVATLLDTDLRPKPEEIPDEVQSKKEKDDDDYIGANLRFYRNQVKFRPHGEYIDNIHKYWYGDFKGLENNHTFIQWLFPISEKSRLNPEAVPLRQHEARHIHDDSETRERVIKSYRLMLDFFGFELNDEETGKITRSNKWKDRFYNFKRSYHNHFRVTRIVRSLGELGFAHYQAPFILRLLHEIYETGELQGVPPITIHYWLRTIDTDFDRDYVYNQFKDKIVKHEKDYKVAQKHEVNMYYYDVLPKKRKTIAEQPARQQYR